MEKPSAGTSQNIAHADAMAAMWLNRGNEARTRIAADRAFEKAQDWLDRANRLRESTYLSSRDRSE